MIQRKQTLFLMQIAFLAISFLFVPVQFFGIPTSLHVKMLPLNGEIYSSTSGHLAAIGLNFLGLVIAVATIFLYRKRDLQVKLCYLLMVIYIIIPAMVAFCPFIEMKDVAQKAEVNIFTYIISAVCVISAYFAARFVKKDIELLKNSERIR